MKDNESHLSSVLSLKKYDQYFLYMIKVSCKYSKIFTYMEVLHGCLMSTCKGVFKDLALSRLRFSILIILNSTSAQVTVVL